MLQTDQLSLGAFRIKAGHQDRLSRRGGLKFRLGFRLSAGFLQFGRLLHRGGQVNRRSCHNSGAGFFGSGFPLCLPGAALFFPPPLFFQRFVPVGHGLDGGG